MERNAIKSLIELAETWKDADKIIEEFTQFRSVDSKLAYLYGMFDVAILGSSGESDDADYQSVLSTIVNKKWR